MKKLKKMMLKDASVLTDEEKKVIIGGADIKYQCIRVQKTGDNAFMCYTFTCEGEAVKNSWINFWTSAGWDAACVDPNGSNSNLYLC